MTARYGAFGKIPALGDFFRLALSQDFVAPWDRWLQASIVEARAALGAGFQDAYMSAPIWRFSLPPGVAGRSAVSGILMASVDQVGRLFPLTLAQEAGTGGDVLADHAALLAVATDLEETALDALSDTLSRDALAARLALCPAPRRAALPPDARYLRLQGGALVPASPPFSPRHSIWSAPAGDGLVLIAADGLPAPLFATLINSATLRCEGAAHD